MGDEPKPGSIVHVEFGVKDPTKVKAFYGDLFGWTFREMPEMNYTLFDAPSGPGGGIGGLPEGESPGILNYILVSSIDETLAKVRNAGGKVATEKMEVPGQGWIASFEDPAGTRMGLWEPAATARDR